MKQIVIISGKGGTGKTFLSGSLAGLILDRVVADCDVDASNLHFLLNPRKKEVYAFKGGSEARVDRELCNGCFICGDVCRFDAVSQEFEPSGSCKDPTVSTSPETSGTSAQPQATKRVVIDPILCEGCAVCSHLCPQGAISMQPRQAGEWYVSDIERGTMVHARLNAGEENSGKLVTAVRNKAKQVAVERKNSYIIIDGPPGTGCAVIAALSGVDFAAVVTEPTITGIHDMERVLDLADYFSIKTGVVINKENINRDNSNRIREYCERHSIPILGSIPYAKKVVDSVSKGIPYVDYADDEISDAIKKIWDTVRDRIKTYETKGVQE